MNDRPENDQAPHAPFLGVGHLVGGRYRIEGMLGRGGMGIVYAATHQLTQRRVAVKVLEGDPGELPAQRERFLSEARTAAAVRHPNIVDILDMGTHHGAPFLVMELLEGSTLDPVLSDRRALSHADCLNFMLPIIGALATLHDAGIVHRDVKPSNIFLYRAGPHLIVPKLLDFGLARAVGDARLTRSGVVIGTPLYMAPEHAAGAQVGPAADVWSTGVVLFECMTGALPYSSTDRAVIAAQVLAGHVRPVRQVRPDLPEPLAEAIDLALQRDLGRRHASMRALAQALVTGAIMSGVALPEQLAPVGLPDYPLWRREAHRRVAERTVEATHELSAPLSRADASTHRAGRRRTTVALSLLVLLAGLTWLYARPDATPEAPTRSDVASPDQPPATAPALPSVEPIAPTSVAGAVGIDAGADASAPKPAEATKTAKPASAPSSHKASDPSPRRSPPAESARKKSKARAPEAPAEVETEWK
jgi:serine/threonine protein kinase